MLRDGRSCFVYRMNISTVHLLKSTSLVIILLLKHLQILMSELENKSDLESGAVMGGLDHMEDLLVETENSGFTPQEKEEGNGSLCKHGDA